MTPDPDVEIVARMIEECVASPGWFYEDIATRILSALRERGWQKNRVSIVPVPQADADLSDWTKADLDRGWRMENGVQVFKSYEAYVFDD